MAPSPQQKPAEAPKQQQTIGNYILGKCVKNSLLLYLVINSYLGRDLGKGTFGKVKVGTHILTGEKVAVKILEKDKIADVSDVERVAREIHILKIVRHPHVVQLYEIIET